MGVRGLMSFLERENHKSRVNVSNEIHSWMRNNPYRSPIIVFDFVGLTHCESNIHDNICGGRHNVILDNFDKLLSNLKETGAKLVFFTDLNAQPDKTDEWLKRRDESFKFNIDLYNQIRAGELLGIIALNIKEKKNLSSASFALSLIAKKYGEFHYATEHECDLEMARYATENRAFAIVSNDSDFLIYDGDWKYWSATDFGFTNNSDADNIYSNQIDRNGIEKSCGLIAHQRPLLATLMGNEYANGIRDELFRFHKSLGPAYSKVKNIASYIQRKQGNQRLLDSDFKIITKDVFGIDSPKWCALFEESVNSYNLNYPKKRSTDLLAAQLMKTPYYRDYVTIMGNGQGFTLSFYDMRGMVGAQTLPRLFTEWIKRKSGILRQHKKDDSYTFVVLAKFSFYEKYRSMTEKPIYPHFSVPSLNTLYLKNTVAQICWDLLAFIMSLSDNIVTAIQSIRKEYRLICTTLYALVKGGFCSMDQADGILFTEYMVQTDENTVRNIQHPKILVENNVRVAHVYNNTFQQVRQNFTIAGLLTSISDVSRFDGVYFQHIMTHSAIMRDGWMAPCQNYRIYRN